MFTIKIKDANKYDGVKLYKAELNHVDIIDDKDELLLEYFNITVEVGLMTFGEADLKITIP